MEEVESSSEEEPDSNATQTDSGGTERWKLALVGLAFVGGLLHANLYTNSLARAVGAGTGSAIASLFAIYLATATYRRFDVLQLGLVRSRIYILICLISGLGAALGGLFTNPSGVFGFLFVFLYLLAAICELLYRASLRAYNSKLA